MPVDFDAYNNGDVILNNLLFVGTAVTFIAWFLIVCRNAIKIQELRSGLENQSWLWLPGLSSFTYYVPRLSTEHLEKILSSRKELPSEEVPNIVVPFHVKHVHVRDIEDGSHRLGCTILSTLPGVTVSALWMVHARVRHVLNSSESSLEEVVKDLMENAPYKTELSLRNSAAAGSELVGDDTSSPLLPVSGQLDRSSETESVVAASEYLLDGLVPPEIARTTATLRSLLSSNMPTVEPLVLVLRPALACEDLSAPQVMVFVVHFSGSLQGRVVRQLYLLKDQPPIEMLEIFGYEDNSDCVICLSEEAEIILLPCRHVCVCETCFKEVDKCPVCRAEFETFIKFQHIDGGTDAQETKPNKRTAERRQGRRRLKFWRSKKKRG